MKVLQIGCGGIGSYFTEELFKAIDKGYMTTAIELSLADGDMVEPKQILWQNFAIDEIGQNKAEAVGKRYNLGYGGYVNAENHRKILKDFDLIVLCVDNDMIRGLVTEYCHKHDKEFIDLRATGRKIFAMPKLKTLQENMKFIDKKDLNEYSCQDKTDLEKGWVQTGNKIIADIGVQMVINHTRGHQNHVINSFI